MTIEQKPEVIRTPEVMIHDWDHEGSEIVRNANFRILDTTLRDGRQKPKIKQPSIKDQKGIIDLNAKAGIDAIDICMPGTRGKYYREGIECAKYIHETYPDIDIVVLARTIEDDVVATMQFSEEAGVPLSVILFRGTSDLRLIAEDWNEDQIVEDMFRFSTRLKNAGQKVICATEDTTRTRPTFLKKIFEAGIEGGATELCVADTVGYADPVGVKLQMEWIRREINGAASLPIHFHGHDDTRNSVANSIAAIKAVPDVIVHATWLGVGERAGNTPMEGLLSDLDRRNIDRYDLGYAVPAIELTSKSFNVPIPANQPLAGEVVFTNMSGIHTAAIYKALQMGRKDIAGVVYSAVSPFRVGREHKFNIGTLSGKYNVIATLDRINKEYGTQIEYSDELARELLRQANIKNSDLDDEEVIRTAKPSGENGNGHLVME